MLVRFSFYCYCSYLIGSRRLRQGSALVGCLVTTHNGVRFTYYSEPSLEVMHDDSQDINQINYSSQESNRLPLPVDLAVGQ